MFGSKRVAVTTGDHVGTIIGQGTQFKGSINANGGLRIDGEVEGDIVTSSEVVVGETGVIKAVVKAKMATVGGAIYGNMEVTDKLELLPSAKVIGDIKVGILIIGEGAVFKGGCEMRHSEGTDKKGKENKS